MNKLIFLLVITTIAAVNIYGQAIPKQISYQGVLKDANGNLVNGDQALTFRIYNDPTGGTPLWTEIQVINVNNGLFNAFLGSNTPITGVPFDRIHFLGIQVGTETELSPRTLLTPTPYSFMAMDIMDNTVTSSKIVNLTITGSDIANNTIGPEKLTFTPGGGTIGGSGTANYIPRFMDAITLGNSAIFQSGTMIGIGTTNPTYPLQVSTNRKFAGLFTTDSLDHFAAAVCGEYLGTGDIDAVGVYGKSVPADFYGIGGFFEGGFIGVRGRVTPSGSEPMYCGVYGAVSGGTSPAGNRYGLYGLAIGTGTGIRYGVYGYANGGGTNWAGYFDGNVRVIGVINPAVMQSMIDHPLDPANKLLNHSAVESADMMNIYNGNIILDNNGEATIQLPDWFEALNKDFRYQVTAIGAPGPNLYIASEINNNQMKIAGGEPGMKVSWQVTGIRKDAFAEKNRIQVEVMKQGDEVGKYLHPEAFGLPETMSIDYEKNNPEKLKASR